MGNHNNSPAVVHCFVDADVLIHFRMFDEVEWTGILASPLVYLILAPSVMRELNKHKDDSTNAWRQKRARGVVAKLRKLLRDATPESPVLVRDGVFVFDIYNEPSVDWAQLRLDAQLNDDRLLATIHEFRRQSESGRVILISNDFLLQRKAQGRGIEVVDPRDHIDRHERPQSDAVLRLKRELSDLKSRRPDLEFGFWEREELVDHVKRSTKNAKPGVPSDGDILRCTGTQRRLLDQVICDAQGAHDEREIEQFAHTCEQYLQQLDAALRMNRSREFGPRLELRFAAINRGSAPAIRAIAEVWFPDESFIVETCDQYDEGLGKAVIPEPPIPDWQKSSWDRLVGPPILTGISTGPHGPEPIGPLYDWSDRSFVQFTHPNLRHKEQWLMSGVTVWLPPSVAGGFPVNYYVHADDLREPLQGSLNVVLESA